MTDGSFYEFATIKPACYDNKKIIGNLDLIKTKPTLLLIHLRTL